MTKAGVKRYEVRYPKYKTGGYSVKKIMTAPTYSEFKATIYNCHVFAQCTNTSNINQWDHIDGLP